MIRFLVDFALRERFLVLAFGLILLLWGEMSFHTLPVEAYPEVADIQDAMLHPTATSMLPRSTLMRQSPNLEKRRTCFLYFPAFLAILLPAVFGGIGTT